MVSLPFAVSRATYSISLVLNHAKEHLCNVRDTDYRGIFIVSGIPAERKYSNARYNCRHHIYIAEPIDMTADFPVCIFRFVNPCSRGGTKAVYRDNTVEKSSAFRVRGILEQCIMRRLLNRGVA